MSLATAAVEGRETGLGRKVAGVTVLSWIVILLYVAGLFVGYELSGRLALPGDGPGQDPPWYFIREDFLNDSTVAVAMLLGCALAIVALRRRRAGAADALYMSLFLASLYGWPALVVLAKTRHLLSPELATTSWSTFEAYAGDPVLWGGRLAVVIAALGCRFVAARRRGSAA